MCNLVQKAENPSESKEKLHSWVFQIQGKRQSPGGWEELGTLRKGKETEPWGGAISNERLDKPASEEHVMEVPGSDKALGKEIINSMAY